MDIAQIFSDIINMIVSLWDLVSGIIEIFNSFINIIPPPFNYIIRFSIPLCLLIIVLKVKRAI